MRATVKNGKRKTRHAPLAVALRIFALFALPFFIAPSALALSTDRDQPIHLDARAVLLNEKTGISVYQGNVVLRQGSIRIEADRIEVLRRNQEIKLIRAFGDPVRLRQRPDQRDTDVHVTARRLEYRVPQRSIELFEDVTLRQGEDVFSAGRAQYDMARDSFRAEGGSGPDGRVTAVFQPRPEEADKRPAP